MYALRRIPLIVVWSLCVSMTLIGVGASAPTGPPLPQHDSLTTDHGPVLPDPPVTVHVRALVPDKIKLSDPAQGTVRATVLTRDRELNQVTVQTQEGQRLVLYLTPATLAGLRIGAPCLLQV